MFLLLLGVCCWCLGPGCGIIGAGVGGPAGELLVLVRGVLALGSGAGDLVGSLLMLDLAGVSCWCCGLAGNLLVLVHGSWGLLMLVLGLSCGSAGASAGSVLLVLVFQVKISWCFMSQES